MDKITKSLLDSFATAYEYNSFEEEVQFELFASYLCILNDYNDDFDPEETLTGGGQDIGIDAVAVLVNGSIVTDLDQIDEAVTQNGYIDATFILVQAKRSPNFDGAEISNFCLGVKQFFSDNLALPANDKIKEYRTIVNKIYSFAPKFRNGNPTIKLYYVTTGRWLDDAQLKARIDLEKKDIEITGLFKSVLFTPIDSTAIQKLYQTSKNSIEKEISLPTKIAMPDITGVSEAYLGIMPAKDFITLITDENNKIIKSLFYDNVRDWQQFNDVNSEIQKTISDATKQKSFVLMNNGVTLVARKIQATGQKLFLKDYQIVNGCQTSHVLVESSYTQNLDQIYIPIKIIATEDDAIKAAITQATNRQTEIKPEQLHALSDFQKGLESFFQAVEKPYTLYYERRSRQYTSQEKIEKPKIISMTSLMRAYASAFMREPHRATRDFRSITESIGGRIFGKDDKYEPYYLSAYLLYLTDHYFRVGLLNKNLRPAKYHIVLGVLLEAAKVEGVTQIPPSSTNATVKFCNTLLTKRFWVQVEQERIFKAVETKLIKLAGNDFSPDKIRTKAYTDSVLNEYST